MLVPLLGLGLGLPTVALSRNAAAQVVGGTAQKPIPAIELKGRVVEDVRIVGNTTVSYTLIQNLIRTQVGDHFDPIAVQEDYQRIFNLKKFANVIARVEPTETGGVIVVFEVAEQNLLKSVAYRGNREVTNDTLKPVLDIKPGEAIDTFRIELARQAIANLYRDQNYPLARVQVVQDELLKGNLIFDIVEGPKVRIRDIEFVGVHSLLTDTLKDQIKAHPYVFIFYPGKYDPDQIDEDVASVRRYYESKGFFDARVDRKLIFSPDNSELEIDFVVEEGPRYTVNRISFEGNSQVGEAEMRKRFKMQPGMVWDQEIVDRDRKQIVDAYSKFGYIYQPEASDPSYLVVEPKKLFLDAPGKVDLIYRVHEGKPFHVEQIEVRGNYKSMSKLVLREFRDVVPGSLYNSGEVQNALERLKATRYFQSVTVNPVGDDPAYRDILVEVAEDRTASFNIGAGINSNGGIGGNITYRQTNFDIANVPNNPLDPSESFSEHAFTGAGQQFVASFEPGTIATNASLQFSEPHLFDQSYGFSNDLYLRDRVREEYDDRRLGDQLGLFQQFDYTWRGSVSMRAEEVKIYHVFDARSRSEQILDAQGDHPLTGLGAVLRRETVNPGFPYKGSTLDIGYEYVGALGGEYHFHKINATFDDYVLLHEDLLDRKTVLRFHLAGDYIPGEAPFFERYYGGGIGSIRGFRYRGVSPRDGRGNDPVGGDFAFTGTVEVNFPIYQEMLRGVVFSDFGDVESQVHIGTIRSSLGAGVRIQLPLFGQVPLAIDFAVPMNKGRQDNTQLISFSLGWSQ